MISVDEREELVRPASSGRYGFAARVTNGGNKIGDQLGNLEPDWATGR